MGIYIQCFADIPSNVSRDGLPARLAESARAWTRSRGIEGLFFSGEPSAHGVWITFYPPNGGIAFKLTGERIQFDVKTSISGPGFHAAVIDLCDALGRDLSLQWRWDAGGDETGYALTRDLAALNTAFADQFLAHCRFIHADPDGAHAVNLAFGLAMDREDGVSTPLGPLPAKFFIDAIDDAETLNTNAERFYPWWDSACYAAFWRKTSRALLWTEVEWRVPRTDYERFLLQAANGAAGHVNLDSDGELSAALRELNDLAAHEDAFEPPRKNGIGYGKRRRAFILPGRWRINLPGYYIEQIEQNGETTCLWFGTEEIRGSSLTFNEARSDFPWSTRFRDSQDNQSGTCTFRLSPTARPTSDDPNFHIVSAEFFTKHPDGKFENLLISLCDARADLLRRLEEIAREVWYEAPRELPSGSYDA